MLHEESTVPVPTLLNLRQRSEMGWHHFPPQNVDAAGQKAPTSGLQGGREGNNACGGHRERSCRQEAATGDDRPAGCRDKRPQRARPVTGRAPAPGPAAPARRVAGTARGSREPAAGAPRPSSAGRLTGPNRQRSVLGSPHTTASPGGACQLSCL